MKNILKLLFSRVFIIAVVFILQITLIVGMIIDLNENYTIFYYLFQLISAVVVIEIANGRSNPSFKVAWMVPIVFLPVLGVVLYLLFGNKKLGRRQLKRISGLESAVALSTPDNAEQLALLAGCSPDAALQANYLNRYAHAPVWADTSVTYFPSGEAKFEELKKQLSAAKRYIFIEYFIIEQGLMWDSVLEILRAKVAEGVDVRVVYDDFGCIMKLPDKYFQTLRSYGIKAYRFNKFTPVLDVRFNNRDHRKIVVIDGLVGFCGGVNLADEYINHTHPFGYWKDTAVMLRGDAVYSLTAMFLSLWQVVSHEQCCFSDYRADITPVPGGGGFVTPYGDYPYDSESVGENVYLNLLAHAKKYVHICTPYLITDNEMQTALCNAAKSGVEVVIATPGIPDKPYVYTVTRSNYAALIEAGVKIYEYTPGFLHAKSFIVDGLYATVGTINLDYRSFYFHLECGVWMYRVPCIADMERDFQQTVAQSTAPGSEIVHPKWIYRLGRTFMKLIAPLM